MGLTGAEWLYDILMPDNWDVRKPSSGEEVVPLVIGESCGRLKHKLELLPISIPPVAIAISVPLISSSVVDTAILFYFSFLFKLPLLLYTWAQSLSWARSIL